LDYGKVIKDLQAQRDKLDHVIATLEEIKRSEDKERSGPGSVPAPRSRRGRKTMAPDERLKISERMKQYWAARRAT